MMNKDNVKKLPDKLQCERGLISAWTESEYDGGWKIKPIFFSKPYQPIVEKIHDLHDGGEEYSYGAVFTNLKGEAFETFRTFEAIAPDYGDYYVKGLLKHRIREKQINYEDASQEQEWLEEEKNDGEKLQIWKPSQFRNYETPKDFILVGDSHLTRGSFTVIGGYPGVGKSRSVIGLAVAGATGKDWQGLKVHSQFKTLVLQVENGDNRLKEEFQDIGNPEGVDLDEWLGVSRIPVHGLEFQNEAFRKQVKALIKKHKPGVLVIDAWNRVAGDDKARDYKVSLDAIYSCLPNEQNERPAVVIVHHMRKKSNAHTKRIGKDLLHELSGSYCLGSAARSVFVLESATTDTTDDRLVFTCCKNNDGPEGERSAWHRKNGLFAPCLEFDWEEFDKDELPNGQITVEQVRDSVGVGGVSKSFAARKLISSTGKSKATAFRAIKNHMDMMEEDTKGQIYRKGELSQSVSHETITETL